MALTYSNQITAVDNVQVEATIRQALVKKAVAQKATADADEKIAVGRVLLNPIAYGRRAFLAAITDSTAAGGLTDAQYDTIIGNVWPAIILAAKVDV